MTDNKRTASSKRTIIPRDSTKTDGFIKNWEKLSRSGKHDMNILKQAMLLLIANDSPLSADWKDHKLKGELDEMRECHIKGDLVLVYKIISTPKRELVVFARVGTHSEIF